LLQPLFGFLDLPLQLLAGMEFDYLQALCEAPGEFLGQVAFDDFLSPVQNPVYSEIQVTDVKLEELP
jgi:hypothetical protein